MTNTELKALLEGPLPLLGVMLFASALNMLKQIVDARRNGSTLSCAEYLSHWPETLTTLAGNVLVFGVLVMSDQLNFASAIATGYGMNSLADMVRSGGRSAALAAK
jgi:hypothetical protein